MDKILKRNRMFRVRSISDKNILLGNNICFEFNEVAHLVWQHVDGKKTTDCIIDELLKVFDVDRSILENDVYTFIDDMIDKDVLIACDPA